MQVRGSRVAVIGGSIAGCAAAVALERLGCRVEVFERSSGALRDRGSGIAIPLALRDGLIGAGYLPASYPSCEPTVRWWVTSEADGGANVLWEQPSAAAMSNWGVLWRALREGVPDERYHDGAAVEEIAQTGDGVALTFAGGGSERFDVAIGADGYRSIVRQRGWNSSVPEYAGYILWRGNFPESDLRDRAALATLDSARAWLTVCFDGGHGVMYPIPDFGDAGVAGERRVNWAIYAPQPAGLSFDEPTSVPPGDVGTGLYADLRRLLDEHFPDEYRSLFDSPRPDVSIQPIYDQLVHTYVDGRLLLVGDAGTVSRPHTGSGATKAMQDALCLESLGREHDDWTSLATAYDADRTAVGRSLVELGRRIGRDQVESTPAWSTMTPADFDRWTKASLSGESLYFYGNTVPPRT
jgi:2-polyprenyl-6-methoxyphenol hydroxylase-like FAD-dependent oxidoreductase